MQLLGYQEQSYLLDPYLERFVLPVIEAVKAHAHATVMQEGIKYSKARMNRLCRHLYGYIRFRGYKNIGGCVFILYVDHLLRSDRN